MWPSNDTGLSLAGILKWLALLIGAIVLITTISERTDPTKANQFWPSIAAGLVAFGIAWALWFFWQRNED